MTTGILAIWNNCAPGYHAAYEDWYINQHLPERLGIPGFQRGRRYTAVGPGTAFFTYYETETPAVMESAAYVERVDNPTPETREMMSNAFTDMDRTVGRVATRVARARGGVATVLRLNTMPDPANLNATVEEMFRQPGVARAEVWMAAQGAPMESAESRLRGGDQQSAACVFVETLREAEAWGIHHTLSQRFDGTAAVYRLLCELTS